MELAWAIQNVNGLAASQAISLQESKHMLLWKTFPSGFYSLQIESLLRLGSLAMFIHLARHVELRVPIEEVKKKIDVHSDVIVIGKKSQLKNKV